MNNDALLVIVLICAVGYLVYLDWLRQGEIDFLSEEVLKLRTKYSNVGEARSHDASET